MQKAFQYLLVLLLLLLPFHAIGVTVINNLIYGSEFGAPVWIKIWKEIIVLGIIIVGSLLALKNRIKPDFIDFTVVSFTLVALAVSIANHSGVQEIIYGIKYDLLPLWMFLVLKYTPVSHDFFYYLLKNIGYIGSIIVGIGILFFFLPQEFFIALGYSADTSFYAINRPLASCQMISHTDICRAQSTLSGPNQLAAYLLFLIPLFLYLWGSAQRIFQKYFWVIFSVLGGVLLILSFSRSAWIALFIGFIVFFILAKDFPTILFRKIILSSVIVSPLLIGGVLFFIFPSITQTVITRSASSSEHYQKSMEGIDYIIQNPLGEGLGSAGAASKLSGDFIGIVPENWYLQIGIETGIGGMILFVLLVFLIVGKILENRDYIKNKKINMTEKKKKMVQKVVEFFAGKRKKDEEQQTKQTQKNFILLSVFLCTCIVSLSIMGLMLHSWESSVVSYTVWSIAGVYFSVFQNSFQK